MNRTLNILILTILIMVVFSACEEKTNWSLERSQQFLVIDALITNELIDQKVIVSSGYNSINGKPESVSGVDIIISDGINQYTFQEALNEPGTYISASFAAELNKTYTLYIKYNTFKDSALAQMAEVSTMNSFRVQHQNNLYKYVYTGSTSPAMTEVYYNWSEIDTFCTYYGSCDALQSYYTINSFDVNEEFGPPKQQILFPSNTRVIRRKYSLSQAHQNFIRSLLLETTWSGGLFDVEKGNIPTNFKNGSRGWFACCAVISDTTIVK